MMRKPSKELVGAIFGQEVDYVDGSMVHKKEGVFLPIRFTEGNLHEMPLCHITSKMKEWIMHWEQAQGVCSHKTFYTQSDGCEWYAGFSDIKTTYDDKITYKDLGKGDTEYEAVLDMAEDISKE